jgi:hypothetical protein
MDHEHPAITTGSPITDMEIMWVLMAVMFAWNVVMAYQHYKLNKKSSCSCKGEK